MYKYWLEIDLFIYIYKEYMCFIYKLIYIYIKFIYSIIIFIHNWVFFDGILTTIPIPSLSYSSDTYSD